MGDFTTQAAKLEHAENRYKNTTIEEAVAQMVKDSGETQSAVITTLVKILKKEGVVFRLSYGKCIERIDDQKSVHVQSANLRELAIRELLLEVAEKGWDKVYIDQKNIPIKLITHTRDPKGKIQYPREKIIRRDPETGKAIINQKTGKEKFTYSKAVRQHKTVTEKYTGEPILFKEYEAMRYDFAKFLTENDLPDPWAVKEPSSKQKDTTETPKDEISWGSDFRNITITITNERNLSLENKENGKLETIHPSVFGLCPKRSMKPNKRYKILGDMLNNKPVKVNAGTATNISRLGKSLKDYFNIDSNPFYINNKHYYPVFNIESQQENQNKQLVKASAISRKHISLDQIIDPELARLVREQEEDDEGTY